MGKRLPAAVVLPLNAFKGQEFGQGEGGKQALSRIGCHCVC